MKKCPNCGAQVDDNSLFCTECGKQIPQSNVCSHCGASVSNGDTFCQNCGNRVDGSSVPNTNFQAQMPYATRSNSQNKLILPIIIGGVVFVMLILAGGGWWYYNYSKSKMDGYEIFLNDTDSIADVEEVLMDDADSIEEIVEDYIDVDSIASDDIIADNAVDDSQYSDVEIRSDKNEDKIEYEEKQSRQVEDPNKVFDVVEQTPSFPGGDAALMRFLSTNVHYPAVAEENGIQGRVVVTFIIERDGSISDVKVVKSVDPSLDKEAVRVIESMPRWKAGTQNGEPVRVKYTMPVTFRLQ